MNGATKENGRVSMTCSVGTVNFDFALLISNSPSVCFDAVKRRLVGTFRSPVRLAGASIVEQCCLEMLLFFGLRAKIIKNMSSCPNRLSFQANLSE